VGAALAVAGDLADPAAAADLVAQTAEALGPVECLVNNVGDAYQAGFEELTDDQWDAMWQLNVMSYVRCIRAVLPGMKDAGGGTIVNVSSTAGKRPSTGMPNYSVTKAAVLSLSRLVADLYAKHGIRCNAVAPGPTATPAWLAEGGLADQQAASSYRGPSAGPPCRARRNRLCDRISLFGARFLRDGLGLERRRRNRPDHHLA
jgi:NAD(P)-dependent dehydrogenase (short-subunit alcohol dehydrogenase family)